MSRNSKARRDAKKKQGGARRAHGAPTFGASILAHLLLDGVVFAAMKKAGEGWTMLMGGSVVPGASDPQTIMGLLQAIAYLAEDKGYDAVVQASDKLLPLLGVTDSDAAEAHYEALARKILAAQPLPPRLA